MARSGLIGALNNGLIHYSYYKWIDARFPYDKFTEKRWGPADGAKSKLAVGFTKWFIEWPTIGAYKVGGWEGGVWVGKRWAQGGGALEKGGRRPGHGSFASLRRPAGRANKRSVGSERLCKRLAEGGGGPLRSLVARLRGRFFARGVTRVDRQTPCSVRGCIWRGSAPCRVRFDAKAR